MDIKELNRIIDKEINGKYTKECKFSKTTNSYYVNISNGETTIQLRFADHLTPYKNTKTFLVTKKMNKETVSRYVRNRIRTLQTVSLYKAFDMLESKRAAQLATC